MTEPTTPCDRRRLRDGLLTVIGQAANLELPDWSALVDLVEEGIERLTRALTLVEEEAQAERAGGLWEHARRLPDWTVLLDPPTDDRG